VLLLLPSHFCELLRPGSPLQVLGRPGADSDMVQIMGSLPFWSTTLPVERHGENSITKDVWNTRHAVVAADHRLPNARADLELIWKKRLISKGDAAAAGGASDPQVTENTIL
jgi:hypothetical protein